MPLIAALGDQCFAVTALGGKHGYYAVDWLSRLRGTMDRLTGGPTALSWPAGAGVPNRTGRVVGAGAGGALTQGFVIWASPSLECATKTSSGDGPPWIKQQDPD